MCLVWPSPWRLASSRTPTYRAELHLDFPQHSPTYSTCRHSQSTTAPRCQPSLSLAQAGTPVDSLTLLPPNLAEPQMSFECAAKAQRASCDRSPLQLLGPAPSDPPAYVADNSGPGVDRLPSVNCGCLRDSLQRILLTSTRLESKFHPHHDRSPPTAPDSGPPSA